MKRLVREGLLLTVVALIAGCAHFPTKNESIAVPATIQHAEIIELVIDAGRQAGFPPATKVDKANGVVEFGAFGLPVLGITAQVRVRNNNTLDTTVQRGSAYIPLSVDPAALKLKNAIEKQFHDYKPAK